MADETEYEYKYRRASKEAPFVAATLLRSKFPEIGDQLVMGYYGDTHTPLHSQEYLVDSRSWDRLARRLDECEKALIESQKARRETAARAEYWREQYEATHQLFLSARRLLSQVRGWWQPAGLMQNIKDYLRK